MQSIFKTMTCSAAMFLTTTSVMAHEGGDGEHLNLGFYYGHDGSFEAPADPPEPATLLVDTHPWELDTVFYGLTPATEAPFNGWSSELPGFRALLEEGEEYGGHGYYSWLNPTHGVATPDLRLHLIDKDADLMILDPGTGAGIASPFVLGTNAANHHLIYYVDQSTGRQLGDVLTATFYLTDANGGLAQSEDFTLQFRLVPEAIPGDTDGDGDIDNSDLQTAIANFTGPQTAPPTFTKTAAEGDTDDDGAVSNTDLQTAIANFTGPIGTPVPEPASAVLLGAAGLLAARRRR